ncbi:riboflavin synthase [Buchnera aphidicola]|uniref:Riboflavin synthase n=1 Tax=Buchnera aphidicola str. USDA (Myzus persicae) TaxID=1009856 RepID=W0P5D7_BUCMP|nr:riboflavin synthase [Buchnera aphidicola]AHG60258.1 Ribe [Buchnera aphidicola str. USDA (Myzus persicae)]AHG60836.1 Ribe [Buchnera aphidicola str. W106 (Myzus persicae)]AHG61408.1 Ribe [Buchnera aphidicola str. G002 (Myzus persicae)]AHG61981.1 Ribe [Buchnera aphidicola str. F009 (Myzus persicae)]WAI03055.1 MAG: riboflavin synthase [Buchnera aphidicola (Myzus persicae)]
MFTGIVHGIGNIVFIEKKKKSNIYMVKLPSILSQDLKIGASVAHNGCCLTVKCIDNDFIVCDAVEETLKNTNLGILNIGDYINIERSVKYGDEIGGHIISGHIIDTTEISKILKNNDNCTLWLKVRNVNLMKYIFYKGFVCLDGVSLTISDIIKNEFCVNIIPHTLLSTTIKYKKNGDLMNLEIDFYTQTIVDTTERLINKKYKNFDLKSEII